MQTLAQSALVLHSRWGHMSDNDRIEEVRQKIAQFSTALEKLTAQRKRNRQQLERLKATREFWLNPWALESWLESQKKVDAFLP
jgi:predicted  nucleic acid-binding Zn-ribbon protein